MRRTCRASVVTVCLVWAMFVGAGCGDDGGNTSVYAPASRELCELIQRCQGGSFDQLYGSMAECVDNQVSFIEGLSSPACRDAVDAGNQCLADLSCDDYLLWGMSSPAEDTGYPCDDEDVLIYELCPELEVP